jgi:hypothetical protein
MLAIGEHFVLHRQERAARIDEVNARQAVLFGDLLRAQMLFHGEREIRAALHRRVVRDDHAFAAMHAADAGDDTRRRHAALGRTCSHAASADTFEKRRAGIEYAINALARQEFPARMMALNGFFAATFRDFIESRLQLIG